SYVNKSKKRKFELILEDKIGSGSFWKVRKGTFRISTAQNFEQYAVAIKTLFLNHPKGYLTFSREVNALYQFNDLNHPYIDNLLGLFSAYGKSDISKLYALYPLAARDFYSFITDPNTTKRVRVPAAIKMGIQVGSAILYLHQK